MLYNSLVFDGVYYTVIFAFRRTVFMVMCIFDATLIWHICIGDCIDVNDQFPVSNSIYVIFLFLAQKFCVTCSGNSHRV